MVHSQLNVLKQQPLHWSRSPFLLTEVHQSNALWESRVIIALSQRQDRRNGPAITHLTSSGWISQKLSRNSSSCGKKAAISGATSKGSVFFDQFLFFGKACRCRWMNLTWDVWIVFYPKTKRTKCNYILYKELETFTRFKIFICHVRSYIQNCKYTFLGHWAIKSPQFFFYIFLWQFSTFPLCSHVCNAKYVFIIMWKYNICINYNCKYT